MVDRRRRKGEAGRRRKGDGGVPGILRVPAEAAQLLPHRRRPRHGRVRDLPARRVDEDIRGRRRRGVAGARARPRQAVARGRRAR